MAERRLKKVIRKIRQFASGQSSPNENGSGAGEGVGAVVKSEYSPSPEEKGTNQRKNFHERVRTTITGVSFIVAIWAACISSDSRNAAWTSANNAGRSAGASERSATASEKSSVAAEQNAATAKATFETVQRASINLGLPDGKIGEFLPGVKGPLIALYFRNYGAVTAQNVIVEFWPLTIFPNKAESKIQIPGLDESGIFGPSMPSGFPFPISKIYTESTVEDLDSGKNFLQVVGRIRYTDSHKTYCESFLLAYIRRPVSKFALLSSGNPIEELNFCRKREFVLMSNKPPAIPPTNVPYLE